MLLSRHIVQESLQINYTFCTFEESRDVRWCVVGTQAKFGVLANLELRPIPANSIPFGKAPRRAEGCVTRN